MEMYMELLTLKIAELTKMIFDIDEMMPNNETQGDYKAYTQQHLATARNALREAGDMMEWYIRKG